MRINLYLIILYLLSFGFLMAQEPNEILGIAKENKTADNYKEQAKLWKQKTTVDPLSAQAWYQYYNAERAYIQKIDYKRWTNNSVEVFEELKPIIDLVEEHIGNSFEYYLLRVINTHRSMNTRKH